MEQPLESLGENILVHDYTEKGLFGHLKTRRGRAVICHAEMASFFEHLLKKQADGASQSQMFSRFHDGNSKVIRKMHGRKAKDEVVHDEREILQKSSLCVGGFSEPQPYINLHQMLGCSGFLHRISICMVDCTILKDSEVQPWSEVLDSFEIS